MILLYLLALISHSPFKNQAVWQAVTPVLRCRVILVFSQIVWLQHFFWSQMAYVITANLAFGYISWLIVDLWFSLCLISEKIIIQKAEKIKMCLFQVFQMRYNWLFNYCTSFTKLRAFYWEIFIIMQKKAKKCSN